MRIRQEDAELTARISPEYHEYDPRYRPELEKKIEEKEQEILVKKAKFDDGRLLQKANTWELFKEFELSQISKIKLLQDFNDGKDRIGKRLEEINNPYILDFSESMMREIVRLNDQKKFEILEDREDSEMNRIFKVKFNYPHVNEIQKTLLDTIEQIRGMAHEPLLRIKETFDQALQGIPERFEFVEQQGGWEFKEWVFSNKPSTMSPDFEKMWLWEAKAKADIAKQEEILSYWAPFRTPNKDREVQKIFIKNKPIIDLGNLMDQYKK
jgi:hypothetical protein